MSTTFDIVLYSEVVQIIGCLNSSTVLYNISSHSFVLYDQTENRVDYRQGDRQTLSMVVDYRQMLVSIIDRPYRGVDLSTAIDRPVDRPVDK